MKTTHHSLIKPQRINQSDIAAVAAAGVARALEARAACMRELSDSEVADVSGGAAILLSKGILAGGIRAALAAQGGLGMSTVNPATFDAGAMGGALTMGF